MRLIDADALYDTFERTPWMDNADRDIAEELADSAPTVNPWVKTSDRLPDKCNRYNMYLTIKKRGGGVWQVSGNFIKEHPELCPYWMPIPPLPEVEE